MAEIKNGFLISARSKVGGTVLYRSKGEQLMRGVPVYPANYIGSEAQVQVRDIFGDISGYVTKFRDLNSVVGGFERVIGRRYKGTFRDQWIGRAFGNIFRETDGSVRSAGTQKYLLDFINSKPGAWIQRSARPPHFRQNPIRGISTVFSSDGKGGITASVSMDAGQLSATLTRMRERGYSRIKTDRISGVAWGTPYSGIGDIGGYDTLEIKSTSASSSSPRMLFGKRNEATDASIGGCLAIVLYATTEGTEGTGGLSIPNGLVPVMSFFYEDYRLYF